jgi:membrane fusion protein (multidrug efflux system)
MNQMKKLDRDSVAEAREDDLRGVDQVHQPVELDNQTEAKRNSRRLILMLLVPLIVLIVGGYFWVTSGKSVGTDNAYVKQDVTSISAQVSGPIAEVRVRESQRVKRGDILYRVDTAPFEVAVMQAQAQLAAAQLQTRQLQVQSAGTGGDIIGEQANLAISQRALERQNALLNQGFTTRASHDDAFNEVQKAQMQLADARARAANAQAAIAPAGNQPQIAAAQATLAKARLDLSHTTIRAPFDGTVANASRLLVGQTVITGLSMLSLVSDQTAWVEANYKEGDLARMHPGQSATVTFDAYPGMKVASHVCSISAGTGSEFSVLPAQNANGNWVKVTQRVPVRICFDHKPPREMIAGLSAKVDVKLDPKQ